jgi:hypothetical protein
MMEDVAALVATAAELPQQGDLAPVAMRIDSVHERWQRRETIFLCLD